LAISSIPSAILSTNSSGSVVPITTSSGISSLITDETGSGALVFATLPTLSGFISNASSTVVGGLTVSGISTTTENLVVQGNASSTFTAGINAFALNLTGTATSTFNNGLNIANGGVNVENGCFSVAGVCVGTQIEWSGITDPTTSLGLNMGTHSTAFNWETGTGASELFSLTTDASANGIGSLLYVQTGTGSNVNPLRVLAGSTESIYVDSSGRVGIGQTSLTDKFTVNGNTTISGNLTASQATTTNLAITTIASSLLKTDANGSVIPAIAGTDYSNFGYLFPLAGNATSTLTQFNGGLTSYASTTIGAGGQATGLTISGGATTTGNLIVSATASVPNYLFAVNGPNNSNYPLASFGINGLSVFTVNSTNGLTLTAGGNGNGSVPTALVLGIKGAINVTSESIPVQFNAPTYTITGSYANQRITQFTQPTITAGSALGITTEANTVNISGAPISAGSATIANSIGLRIGSGTSVASGVTNAYGLYVDAPTGATNNYSAVFNTGNVGIGTTSPYSKLSVVGTTTAAVFEATSTATSTFAGGIRTNLLNVTSTTASSTFANGISITDGCFAVGSTCLSGTVGGSGTTNRIPYWTSASALGSTNFEMSSGNIIPIANQTYDIGSASNALASIYAATHYWESFATPLRIRAKMGGAGFDSIYFDTGTTLATRWIITEDGKFNPGADNSYDIGTGSNRVRNIYAGGLLVSDSAGNSYLRADNSTGRVGIGTSTPYAKLSVVGPVVAEYFHATSTTASSTFSGGLVASRGVQFSLQNCTAFANSGKLTTDASGNVYCADDTSGSGGAYPFNLAGNATSTLTQFNGGLTSYASTTIGGGTAITGLTVSGNSTTTGNAYFAGNVGIGSTTPSAKLAIHQTADTYSQVITSDADQNIFRLQKVGDDAWKTNVLAADFARGTYSSPSVVSVDDLLFNVEVGGYNGTGWVRSKASIGFYVDGAWGSNDHPTRINFNVTPDGSNNSITALTIKNTGNVGIGTTTPQWLLQLATSTRSQLTLSDPSTLTNNHWSFRNAGGIFYLATSSPSTFATSSVSALRIDANGVPTFSTLGGATGCAQFDTNGTLSNTGSACGTGGGSAYPFPLTGNATSTLTQFNGGLTAFASSTIGGGTQTSGLTISGGATTTGNAYFAGNVGVGTEAPNATLHVNGIIKAGNPTSPYTEGVIVVGDGGRTSNYTGIFRSNLLSGGSNDYLSLGGGSGIIFNASSAVLGSQTERMRILGSNGNVGIGTTTPYAKLSVAGETVASHFTATTTNDNTLPRLISTLSTTTQATTTSLAISSIISSLLKTDANGSVIPAIAGTDYENPLTFSSGLTRAVNSVTCDTANASTKGCLSSADWSVFNNKISSSSLSGASVISYNSGTGVITTTPGTFVAGGDYIFPSGTLTSLGSTTLQNFTFTNATGTSATTTNLFSTKGTFTNIFASSLNLSGIGANMVITTDGSGNLVSSSTPQVTAIVATSTTATSSILGVLSVGSTTPASNTMFSVGTSTPNLTVSSLNGRVGIGNVSPLASLHVLGEPSLTTPVQQWTSTASLGLATNPTTAIDAYGAFRVGANGSSPGFFFYNGLSTNRGIILSSNARSANFGGFSIYADTTNAASYIRQDSGDIYLATAPSVSAGSTLAFTDRLTIKNGGFSGIGTSTPQWLLQLSTSTRSQLTLSDGSLTSDHWSFRNAGGIFYLATSSASTFATSSATALRIDANGVPTFSALGGVTGCAQFDTSGTLSNTGSVCGSGGSAYPFGLTGNATSTLTQFNGGLTSYASTTIGAGGQTTGLTISGGATTTGNAYFAGNVGIGSTSPSSNLEVLGKAVFQPTSASGDTLTIKTSTGANTLRFGTIIGSESFASIYAGSITPSGSNYSFASNGSSQTVLNVASGGLIDLRVNNDFSTPGLRLASTGNIGISTTTPWGRLSVEMDTTNPAFVVANQGSSTPSIFVGGVNQNGFVGIGTTTNMNSLARLTMSQAFTDERGSTNAIGGMFQDFTFAPTTDNAVQLGNRLVINNTPGTSATNTAVAQLIRINDSSGRSNLTRGLEILASGGNNTWGVNTALRAAGHTFGVQGITTGLAGGTSTPAAIYGENTGTTQGDILRLYTSSMTSAPAIANFYQELSTFTGTGLLMDFARGSGGFTGNFVDFQHNQNSRFSVTYTGTTTIGQLNQTTNAAGLRVPFGSICVDNDGTCTGTTTGYVAAVGFLTGSTNDLAENFFSFDDVGPGDIIYAKGGTEVGRATDPEQAIIGIVSTKPGIELGGELAVPSGAKKHPIALAGRVPVTLSTENGVIEIGDRIVLSSIPGVGMKEDPTKSGTVVGIAIERFDGSQALSAGTIQAQTEKLPSGSPICTTKAVSGDSQAWGGGNIGESQTKSTGVSYETTCLEETVEVAPSAGTASDMTTPDGTDVKIGQALVLVDLDKKVLTASGGVANILSGDLSLDGGGNILNVRGISSLSGQWSISEDGHLVVESITAKKGTFTESLEVGGGSKPSGITIYDSVTGDPYCFQIASGVMSTVSGKCEDIPNGNTTYSGTPSPEPDTNQDPSGTDEEETPADETTPPTEDPETPTETVPEESGGEVVEDTSSEDAGSSSVSGNSDESTSIPTAQAGGGGQS